MSEANTPPATTIIEPVAAAASSPLGIQPTTETTSGDESGTATTSGESGSDSISGESGSDTVSGADALDTFEFKLPDTITIDEPAMAEFRTFAKENGLTTEGAQKALDFHVKQLEATAKAFTEGQAAAWTETTTAWKTELQADPQFKGEAGAKAQATLGRAFDEYGSIEARQAFDLTGAGWNPHIVRMIHKMATALNEGTITPGGAPPGQRPQTLGGVFYPSET